MLVKQARLADAQRDLEDLEELLQDQTLSHATLLSGPRSDPSGEPLSGTGSGEVSDEEVKSVATTSHAASSSVSLALASPVMHVATQHTPREI